MFPESQSAVTLRRCMDSSTIYSGTVFEVIFVDLHRYLADILSTDQVTLRYEVTREIEISDE